MVVLAAIGIRAFVRSEFGRKAWDRWRLRIPVFGRMMRLVRVGSYPTRAEALADLGKVRRTCGDAFVTPAKVRP